MSIANYFSISMHRVICVLIIYGNKNIKSNQSSPNSPSKFVIFIQKLMFK